MVRIPAAAVEAFAPLGHIQRHSEEDVLHLKNRIGKRLAATAFAAVVTVAGLGVAMGPHMSIAPQLVHRARNSFRFRSS